LHNSDRPKKVGDKLILHTWAGRPYRSKWDWRLDTKIIELEELKFETNPDWRFNSSFHKRLYELAILDGIRERKTDRNTFYEAFLVADFLKWLNNLDHITGTTWDVIRWPKPAITEGKQWQTT